MTQPGKANRVGSETTRRQFLRGAAAGAAAGLAGPWIVPASVFGKNAPSNQVTLAAIGVGGRGGGNVRHNFLSQKDVKLLAACDCFKSRRNRFAAMANKKYGKGVCKPMADFREVLARDDIDGVVISTQDHWHVPLAWHAARAKDCR